MLQTVYTPVDGSVLYGVVKSRYIKYRTVDYSLRLFNVVQYIYSINCTTIMVTISEISLLEYIG